MSISISEANIGAMQVLDDALRDSHTWAVFSVSPPIHPTLLLLGRDRVLARIEQALAMIGAE
jgi:hypothetical protein